MQYVLIFLSILSLANFGCRKKDQSTLKSDSSVEVMNIFIDEAAPNLTLKEWPVGGSVVLQSAVEEAGRGKVWDIKRLQSSPGLAHIQFSDGFHNLTRFAQGKLKFDMRVISLAANDKILFKLDGGYPKRAEYAMAVSAPAAALAVMPAECEQRRASIMGAKQAGEVEILRRSSDPYMAKCIDLVLNGAQQPSNAASWQEIAIDLAQFQPLDGFQLSAVMDPIVVTSLNQGAFHIQLDNIRLEVQKPGSSGASSNDAIGSRESTGGVINGVAVTQGTIRVRRRHENDLDFSKFNPFYWSGRLVRFKIEDYTVSNQNKIKFTFETENPHVVGLIGYWPALSFIYTGDPNGADETTRSKFYLNFDMKPVGNSKTKFEYEWLANMNDPKIAAALTKGKMLVVEFRVFLDENDPLFVQQKSINPHTIFRYYSEFFRIKVGESGLFIDNLESTTEFASASRYSGGWSTIPTVRVEPWRALEQQANNITPEASRDFLLGRTWFHTNFVTGEHVKDEEDDKPIIFSPDMVSERQGLSGSALNAASCNTCHVNNGISLLPNLGTPMHTTVVKTMQKNGAPHSILGQQLQTQGANQEGTLLLNRYEERSVALADGSVVQLRRPIFTVQSSLGVDPNSLAISPRKTPAIIGAGLLEAVSDDTIRSLAKTSKGEVSEVNGQVGRFGWKASQPTIKGQITAALKNDMGVAVNGGSGSDCVGRNCNAGKSLSIEALEKLEAYVALLGTAPRNYPNDPKVLRGEQVFRQLNCQSCHVESLRTSPNYKRVELRDQTIRPYTDLLLHDMGEGLADNSTDSQARKWRTAPLWGLKNVRAATKVQFVRGTNILLRDTWPVAESNPIELLHDGRARSIPEAILWHGGEAQDSVERYKRLPASEREALEAFLWDL